jgi:predicted transcriptional regulator
MPDEHPPRQLLPVVDEHATLIGVVSRRDLLTVFLRPDEDIAADVRQVLDDILLAEPGRADVAVRDGKRAKVPC